METFARRLIEQRVTEEATKLGAFSASRRTKLYDMLAPRGHWAGFRVHLVPAAYSVA